MDSLGDKLDAAIAEAEEKIAAKKAEAERKERADTERQEEAAALARETVLPALEEVVDVARERGHEASAVIPEVGGSSTVEFRYWPGQPASSEYQYSLKFHVDEGTIALREAKHTPLSRSSGIYFAAGDEPIDATKERVQEIAVEYMQKAILEQAK